MHFVRRDSGEQPFYAPAFFVMTPEQEFYRSLTRMVIAFITAVTLLLLTSCTKEYSYEKTCIEYTTINWEDGETMKSWRQVDRPLRNDTSYSIGSARPAVVIVKTECK